MTIESTCHGCGKRLRVGDEYAGRQARCPECGYVYTVPDAPSADATATDAPETGSTSSASSASDSKREEVKLPSPTEEAPDDAAKTAEAEGSNEEWYMKTPEGQIYGPSSRQVLHEWVSEGRVTDDCSLRRGEHGSWTSAGDIFPQLKTPHWSAAHQPGGGTYATPSSSGHSQYRAAQFFAGGRYVQPHRAGMILTFAILGGAFCPIFSIVAWAMGTTDLQQMRDGLMDQSGMGMTQAGQILGMIHTIMLIVSFGLGFFMLICMALAGAAGG